MNKNPKNRSIAAQLICAAIFVAAMPAWAETAGELESTRETLGKWVETQQIISREREDWQVGRDVLEQRIALVQGEIESLEGKISALRDGIRDADSRQREIASETDDLEQAAAVLAGRIPGLESKTRSLVTRLPDPIAARVKPLSRKIPVDPAAGDLSLGQRFQNVIGVLNEVNKFNRDITVTSELRALPDGSTVEVQALYVGLGQGYYVSPDGSSAGYGLPGDVGWEWIAADELASQVTKAIKILQNEDVPAYVPLPVEIR